MSREISPYFYIMLVLPIFEIGRYFFSLASWQFNVCVLIIRLNEYFLSGSFTNALNRLIVGTGTPLKW